MKKALSLFMALVMLVCLVACGSQVEKQEESGENPAVEEQATTEPKLDAEEEQGKTQSETESEQPEETEAASQEDTQPGEGSGQAEEATSENPGEDQEEPEDIVIVDPTAEIPAETETISNTAKMLAEPIFSEDSSAEANGRILNQFVKRTLPEVFSDMNGNNKVYSPLNVYLALGMLAEITDGDTRSQILDALDATDMSSLRNEASALWKATYSDGSADEFTKATVIPAASIWLRNDGAYKEDALYALADYFYASSFSGEMGNPEYTQMMRDWINERTNHLLEAQANNLNLDKDTLISLVTTLYFKARWGDEFNENQTANDVFHAANKDENVPFMNSQSHRSYYKGENFAAVCMSMFGRNSMWIILPDEGYSLEDVIRSESAMAFITAAGKKDMCSYPEVILSIPKFDVKSEMDLCSILSKLGIKDVFNTTKANFKPLTDADGLAVSEINHAACVKIDEEGCEAAAFTESVVAGAAYVPSETVEFICDHPFFFFITGRSDQMLFAGAVNTIGE